MHKANDDPIPQVDPVRSLKWDERSSGRLLQQVHQCNLGWVLDLSATGARVRCRQPLDGVVNIDLDMGGGESIALDAEVVWKNQVGFRKFDHGLKFRDVSPAMSKRLLTVAMGYRPIITDAA